MIESLQIAAEIKQKAREAGFDLVGMTQAERSARADYLRQWLDAGQHGSMEWMSRRFEERVDPSVYLPGAKSVICVAMNYHSALDENENHDSALGRVARYAQGDDYHEIIKDKLHVLADWMRQRWPAAETRACVDTAPLMEKDLAARAGLGWIGKNTCLIHETIGSWIFLGEIVTTLDLSPDTPIVDHCGTCRRCIDACPTQAITEPYQLDARKCISYLTIEHRGDIDPLLEGQMGDWLYGCDICQEVCPHNRKPPSSTQLAFTPRFKHGTLSTEDILQWQPVDYQLALRGSAMKRIKLPLLQRNARIVQINARQNHKSCPPSPATT